MDDHSVAPHADAGARPVLMQVGVHGHTVLSGRVGDGTARRSVELRVHATCCTIL